jgi:leucyl-tRNA synthetase
MATQAASTEYQPSTIEAHWQAMWRDADAFRTPGEEHPGEPTYLFSACPFTSGSAHMGHIRSYSISDAFARFRRARGDAVLFSIGWDAFGLPAELEAIRQEVPPTEWVARCRERMSEQFDRLGYSFDWSRVWTTSEPEMYQWSQWLFLTLLEEGLVYHADGQVDWCDSCRTVLASLQVEDGLCWRCHNPVQLIRRSQWYLRVTTYLKENEERLEDLEGWNPASLTSQRNVLGRVEGVEFEVATLDGASLTVFTPHADAIAQAEFVAISPSHPEVDQWVSGGDLQAQLEGVRSAGVQRSDRNAEAVPIIDTGRVVSGAGAGKPLPVVITPAVDSRFGFTAVLGIPPADRTDEILATRLPAAPALAWRLQDGPPSPRPSQRYRARDFPISRQRAWGPPIPLVHCDTCGTVPVPKEDLPVRLPDGLRASGTGNPLVEDESFVSCTCPTCSGPARRETDTLDCHFDGLWQWMPFAVPREARETSLFDHAELQRWLPVALVIWGADGGGSMFDQRMTAKVLRDRGLLPHMPEGEPHKRVLMHEMVHLDGRKMSKHLGNVVDPDELLERVGADAVRLAVLFGAAPTNVLSWTEIALNHCDKWLQTLWRFALPRLHALSASGEEPAIEASNKLRRRLVTWCDVAASRITENLDQLEMHRAARNIMTLLTRVQDFERKTVAQHGEMTATDDLAVAAALLLLVQLLAPLAPHITEELWAAAGRDGLLAGAPWPEGVAKVD